MIRTVRAAAVAVAAFALTVSAAWAAPLEALDSTAAPVASPWFLHQEAGAPVSDLGLNDEAAPAARTLDERVTELAGGEPGSREDECLASAVYFEARGESLEGQLAVAEVVMNRAASGRYPATLCGVVAQPAQFSFVRGGRIPRADRGSDAWRRAVAIARIARDGGMRMLDETVLWYHADYVSPRWGRRLARASRIGSHIFYR